MGDARDVVVHILVFAKLYSLLALEAQDLTLQERCTEDGDAKGMVKSCSKTRSMTAVQSMRVLYLHVLFTGNPPRPPTPRCPKDTSPCLLSRWMVTSI